MAKATKTPKKGDDFKTVRDALRKKTLEKVYLLYGEDAFLRDKIIREIAEHHPEYVRSMILAGAILKLNTHTRLLSQTANLCKRFIPYMVLYKFYAHLIMPRPPIGDIAILAEYAAHPVRAHLVLTATKLDSPTRAASAKSTPSKTALWKQLAENACAYCFLPLPENDYKGEINAYIEFAAEEKQLPVEPQAVDVIKNLIGPNRALIERAIEKLCLAFGNQRPITPEMVEEQIVDTRERSVFELLDAVSKRDLVKAMTALHVLINQDQEPVVINGMLATHARRLVAVKRAMQNGADDDEITQITGITSYFLRKDYKPAANRYSLAELYRFHADIFDADRSLKSKPMPAEFVFSRVLMNLMQK